MNILIVASLSAKIKNGYEPEINVARDGLKKLNALLDTTRSPNERRKLEEHAARLKDFILYYELTETLLFQFKMISPDIYNEVDTVKDAQAHSVDVYVKFLPGKKMVGSVAGTTNVPLDEEGDTYSSTYGLHSVSTFIVAGNNALSLLAHELGHIRYQVPNIAIYRKFFIKHYRVATSDSESVGHHHTDPSGQNAFEFERKFRLDHDDYLKNNGTKFQRPVALIQSIEREL
jgi:hypothetical protein